jgi:hypothetical protein
MPMPESPPSPQRSSNFLSAIHEKADSPGGKLLRAAISLFPVLGGSASVLVEAHLSTRQAQRHSQQIATLYHRLAELQQSLAANSSGIYPAQPVGDYSEDLLEHATKAAMRTDDPQRPPMFANILCLEPNADPTETLRTHLIDICATLTRYELALLLSLSRTVAPTATTSGYAGLLLEMRLDTPDLADVHTFALSRLRTFQLITDTTGKAEVTAFGRRLLSAI